MTDFSKFKAAMFDYDGTLTKPGVWQVDKKVASAIGQLLAKNFPIAVCTGRQIESFEKRFGEMLDFIRNEFGDEVLSNLYLMAENGAVGYEYKKGKWEMFYIAKWPEEINRDDFEKKLYELVKDKVEILSHLVPIVLAPLGRMHMKFEDVKKKSAEVFKIAKKFVKDYGAENFLHIGDSGLGCLICPVGGDKDTAIKIFYEFLKDKKSARFESDGECREILAVGDNPQKGGNDYYFLNGKYGTPFTVGQDLGSEKEAELPLKVIGKSGKRLFNDEATLYLLNKIENSLN
jgi:HAD superfamily hydrolase (TIGR01484 family)